MTENNDNIGPAFTLPPDMVSLTPMGPELPTFSYRKIAGEEAMSVLIEDAHLGKFEIVLTPSLAEYVSMNLYGMVNQELDGLRQHWAAQQEGGTR